MSIEVVFLQEKKQKANRQDESRRFHPRQENHLPISWMAFECNFIGRVGSAQQPVYIPTHGVHGDGINGKP